MNIEGHCHQVKRQQPLEERKYLQIIYLKRGSYPEYTKNSHNSTTTKQTTQLKNGQRI